MTRDPGRIIDFPGDGAGLHLRVELLLPPATVWRTLVMPVRASFWDLHAAIQDSFGWSDGQVHRFRVDDPQTGERLRLGAPGSAPHVADSGGLLPGWDHPLTAYLKPGLGGALYIYGDDADWPHEVEMIETVANEASGGLPRCSGGAGWPPGTVAEDAPVPGSVVFSDPRRRWRRLYGHD